MWHLPRARTQIHSAFIIPEVRALLLVQKVACVSEGSLSLTGLQGVCLSWLLSLPRYFRIKGENRLQFFSYPSQSKFLSWPVSPWYIFLRSSCIICFIPFFWNICAKELPYYHFYSGSTFPSTSFLSCQFMYSSFIQLIMPA